MEKELKYARNLEKLLEKIKFYELKSGFPLDEEERKFVKELELEIRGIDKTAWNYNKELEWNK